MFVGHIGVWQRPPYSGDYRGRVIPEYTTVVYYVHKLMLKQIKMRQFLIQISRILLLNLLFFFRQSVILLKKLHKNRIHFGEITNITSFTICLWFRCRWIWGQLTDFITLLSSIEVQSTNKESSTNKTNERTKSEASQCNNS